ncbi:MAG: hypothetical protein UT39_C0005G0052 [Candidatus Woesebacteria bacterium GW2011_GWA1_39_21]|uniref:Glycosyltransferase RgtA/B/C/D-like domain-containing protein n=1 Tax=Candidatus Woesebacteria bacterium GW2011_GWA1_39_21 TaxID=1618550 RepID=A0A0G0RD87_9BACT|nr:MAG: hypothetical protein UT39_C0005G0052 [Candidatus Woesebacteria bacterium GW2011_GWA1_39_21]
MGLSKKIQEFFHIPTWLFFILLSVVILRIPNFFEPYSYGDETIYLTLGNGVRNGFTLYKDLHDNKPPLLYITAAIAGNLFWFKGLLLISSLIGIVIFYRFSRKLFPKIRHFSSISTLIFSILSTLPFFEGNIVNAENFMIIPTLLAFYILLFKNNSYKNIFISGILFSISSMYKIPALFDVPAIFIYWVLLTKIDRKNLKKLAGKTLVLTVGIFLPIFVGFLYYTAKGAFNEYLTAAYLQNFGYISSWRPYAQKEPFLVKNAPLLMRAFVVVVINFVLILLRKRVNKKFLFLVSWTSFSLFGITLSERPYPHYLLQVVASLSMLTTLLFTSISMLQVYAILPLTLIFFIPMYFKFWHYRSINYYSNFFGLVTQKIPRREYLNYFGGRTINNYEIAAIIDRMTNKNDRIFVWEDSGQIHALAKRFPPFKYVAGYHISDFFSIEETVSLFSEIPPKIIVIFFDSDEQPLLAQFVRFNYLLYKETSDYQIWRWAGPHSRYVIP